MAARSLNKVQLIGNLTRDPELRYTPAGTAVCTIGLATNRSWSTETGEKREETEYHRLVAWNKLAELCSQLLVKGRKIYVEGRLTTRTWQAQDGSQRSTTEIVIDDMIILDSKKDGPVSDDIPLPAETHTESAEVEMPEDVAPAKTAEKAKPAPKHEPAEPDITPDDIPF
jgi:single-strand DNA-binding protein